MGQNGSLRLLIVYLYFHWSGADKLYVNHYANVNLDRPKGNSRIQTTLTDAKRSAIHIYTFSKGLYLFICMTNVVKSSDEGARFATLV